MTEEPRENAPAAAAAAAAAAAVAEAAATQVAPRTQKRLSLSTYTNRLSGATRTFRDPIEVDVDIRRRFSSSGYSSSAMTGGRRTFRDPPTAVETPRPAARGVDARSSVDRGGVGASRTHEITTTTAAVERRASAPTRSRRRLSIQHWLTARVSTAVARKEQASELLHDSERESLLEEEDGKANHFVQVERKLNDQRDYGDPLRYAMADVFRANTAEEVRVDDEKERSRAPSLDIEDPCAEATRDFQTYLEGDYDSGSGSSTEVSGDGEVVPTPRSRSLRRISSSENEGEQAGLIEQEIHQRDDEDHTVFHEPAVVIKDIYSNTSERGESRRVTFLSGTMGLTVDTADLLRPQPSDGFRWKQHDHRHQRQAHDDHEEWPASPCSGVILETSPRYDSLQAFRKKMSSRGINAQMFHTGWKGRLLPPRDIRLFLADSRKSSVLYWRYKKKPRGGRRAPGGSGDLGAEDRRVIPLSSLANIGPAEVCRRSATAARGGGGGGGSSRRRPSWIPTGTPLRWRDEESAFSGLDRQKKDRGGGKRDEGVESALNEDVPVVALSYWANGEPRWAGDKPKRLLVKPESFDAFRRLTQGLRLCCLHFYNHSCPQDLEDIR